MHQMIFLSLLVFSYSQALFAQPDISGVRASDRLLIQNVQVIDIVSGNIDSNKDILIERGVISEIGKNLSVGEGDRIYNGKGKFVMPGLIDAHIHLFQSGGLYTRPDAIDLRAIRPYDEEIKWLQENAGNILQSYLRQGITTVVDMGGPMYNYTIRSKFQNYSNVPHLYLTGPLISTYQPPAFQIDDPPIIKVNSSAEAKDLVQKQLPFRPDFIKIWYIVSNSFSAESTYDIVKAAIDESHAHGIPVAVHATLLNTAKFAVKAGADILVHSVSDPIDDEFIQMLLAREVVYIPTLVVHGNYNLAFLGELPFEKRTTEIVSPEIVGSLLDVHHLQHTELEEVLKYREVYLKMDRQRDEIRKQNLKKLIAAGVIIGTGTDAGNIGTLHAASYKDELAAMKEAGLDNLQLLKASTFGAAHAIGQQDSLGQIKIGMKANLLILPDNPIENINALFNIERIVFQREVISLNELLPDYSPQQLVQLQLNAYNMRNIEAFLAPYSDSVEVYTFPDKLLYKGKEKMRTRYQKMFDNTPKLHCQLINRIVNGNTVMDQELVTGFEGGREIRAVAIYKIKDGKIVRVYFDDGT